MLYPVVKSAAQGAHLAQHGAHFIHVFARIAAQKNILKTINYKKVESKLLNERRIIGRWTSVKSIQCDLKKTIHRGNESSAIIG